MRGAEQRHKSVHDFLSRHLICQLLPDECRDGIEFEHGLAGDF